MDILEIPVDEDDAYVLFDRFRARRFADDPELDEAVASIVDRIKTRSVPERFRSADGPTLWP